jgi:hypothetical protein
VVDAEINSLDVKEEEKEEDVDQGLWEGLEDQRLPCNSREAEKLGFYVTAWYKALLLFGVIGVARCALKSRITMDEEVTALLEQFAKVNQSCAFPCLAQMSITSSLDPN